MTDMELRAFEAHLDIMVDQIGEESTELIIERPRYAHAVMVLANGDEPGELLTVGFARNLLHTLGRLCTSFTTSLTGVSFSCPIFLNSTIIEARG